MTTTLQINNVSGRLNRFWAMDDLVREFYKRNEKEIKAKYKEYVAVISDAEILNFSIAEDGEDRFTLSKKLLQRSDLPQKLIITNGEYFMNYLSILPRGEATSR